MKTDTTETNKAMESQFFGDVSKPMSLGKECAMIGIMKNKIIVLNDELLVAEAEFGRVSQDETVHWTIKKKKENNCSYIKGKISAIEELMKNFDDLLAVPATMSMQ